LRLLPDRALPHDRVEVQWAVWGVKNATILFGSHLAYNLQLTEQDLSRNYQGVGIWPVRIPGDQQREIVSLRMKNDDETLPAKQATTDTFEAKPSTISTIIRSGNQTA
jgi:hypothetical protein